ncbi:MAG: plasmid stabilization protein [Spirochaetaceae bacterium]|nr:MAG: plasmid stabilization protein [Spirochaetaceae bacterium]
MATRYRNPSRPICSGSPVPEIIYTQSYIRRAQKFAHRHPDLLGQYEKTLRLLQASPSHPSLRLHKLTGKLDGLYSVSINMTYRISLEFIVDDDTVIPVNVGTHDEAYR